jgi:hypothetical protein
VKHSVAANVLQEADKAFQRNKTQQLIPSEANCPEIEKMKLYPEVIW